MHTTVFAQVTNGVQGVVEFVDIKQTIPNSQSLRGLALTYQALAGQPAAIELSNPTSVVLH